jgi:hypothetical protein
MSKRPTGNSLFSSQGKAAMPRFVLLRHEMPAAAERPLHWDFMVESGEVLRTWALAEEPAADRAICAQRLPDHRLAYLDYEGPISNGRGSVARVDRGECSIAEDSPGKLVLDVFGEHLCGRIEIETAAAESWTAVFRWTGVTR